MAKKSVLSRLLAVVAWITGVLVSLAVGFGMADSVLTVHWIPNIATQVAGWIVVIGTILSVIIVLIER